MWIFRRWGLRAVVPVFLGACFFFALFIELIDLVQDLPRYLQLHKTFQEILWIQLLYLPKCLSYGIPIAIVFAVSFGLGTCYANNELIAVFSSGVSLFRFCLPILVFGLAMSGLSFAFQEYVVIGTLKQKNELRNRTLGYADADTNPNVVLFDRGTSIVYKALLYSDQDKTLTDVLVVRRDDAGIVRRIIKAQSARWDPAAKLWIFFGATIFEFGNAGAEAVAAGQSGAPDKLLPDYLKKVDANLRDPELALEPQAFKRVTQNVEELRFDAAISWVETLKKSGLPYLSAQTKLFERFSFACTPFLVTFIACAIGSRFRKNILLLSLLVSLLLSVVYYVIQMISGLLATFQVLSPLVGAWSGVVLYLIVGVVLFRRART
jgi:lipopolysaccharide export system permease protein